MTENEYHWVCPECFTDFQAQFLWRVVGPAGASNASGLDNRNA
jgi:hypothetical protein